MFLREYINGKLFAFQANAMSSNLIFRIFKFYKKLREYNLKVKCMLCKHKILVRFLLFPI